jgi:hypothetical protein
MKNKIFREVKSLTGISAIFVRGLIDEFESGTRANRACQEAGLAYVEELGASISVPYISKLTRMMVEADILTRHKEGRKFVLGEGENLKEFVEYLEAETDYGTRIKGTKEQDQQRSQALDHIEQHGSLRSTVDSRIPPAAYKLLIQKVKEGDLDLVFVQSGLKGGFKYNGTTEVCKPLEV